MPKLVKYGMLSSTTNSLAGNLVKAQCNICGKKYGSYEEAQKCAREHIEDQIIRIMRGRIHE